MAVSLFAQPLRRKKSPLAQAPEDLGAGDARARADPAAFETPLRAGPKGLTGGQALSYSPKDLSVKRIPASPTMWRYMRPLPVSQEASKQPRSARTSLHARISSDM